MKTSAYPAAPQTDVLRGTFDEHALRDVLEIVSIGRQYLGVEVRSGQGERGVLYIKGGQVVSAQAPGLNGLSAFRALFDGRYESYRVFRLATPGYMPTPLGSLQTLMLQVDPGDTVTPAAPLPVSPRTDRSSPAPPPPAASEDDVRFDAPMFADEEDPAEEAAPPDAIPQNALTATAPHPAADAASAGNDESAAADDATLEHAASGAPGSDAVGTDVSAADQVAESDTAAAADEAASNRSAASYTKEVAVAPAEPALAAPPATAPAVAPARSAPVQRRTMNSNKAPMAAPKSTAARLPTQPAGLHTFSRSSAASSGPTLAIASPKGGAGKTTIALNLALSLARRGLRTILVDGDINGDILSSINARERAAGGAYDTLTQGIDPQGLLLKTSIETLSILPAVGDELPDPSQLAQDLSAAWQLLFTNLLANADVVVVDTPAGMYGATHSILRACTHVIGVLQAEAVANRSFKMFERCVNLLDEDDRPAVAGIVLNMLQAAESSSLQVLQEAFVELPSDWLFDVSIPRNAVFLHASHQGLPLGLLDEDNPPAATYLFELLASEVADRLQLRKKAAAQPRKFLL